MLDHRKGARNVPLDGLSIAGFTSPSSKSGSSSSKMVPRRGWKCGESLSDFEDGLRLEAILRLSAYNETA